MGGEGEVMPYHVISGFVCRKHTSRAFAQEYELSLWKCHPRQRSSSAEIHSEKLLEILPTDVGRLPSCAVLSAMHACNRHSARVRGLAHIRDSPRTGYFLDKACRFHQQRHPLACSASKR